MLRISQSTLYDRISLVAQVLDIRVRKGTGRPHRVNLALDRLRERQDPTTLRLVVQARLPRGQTRPSRFEYQRVGSWLIDSRTPQAVARVRAELANLMHTLDKISLDRPPEPRELCETITAGGLGPATDLGLMRELERRGGRPGIDLGDVHEQALHVEIKGLVAPPARAPAPPAPNMTPDEYWHRYGHLPF